jgi:hypothetical protein
MVARERGGYERAAAQFEESAELFRAAGDHWGLGWSLGSTGSWRPDWETMSEP